MAWSPADGFLPAAPHDHAGDRSPFAEMQDVDAVKGIPAEIPGKCDLDFEQGGLQDLDVAFQDEAALVQQRQLVAGILEFPEGVGGDDGGWPGARAHPG